MAHGAPGLHGLQVVASDFRVADEAFPIGGHREAVQQFEVGASEGDGPLAAHIHFRKGPAQGVQGERPKDNPGETAVGTVQPPGEQYSPFFTDAAHSGPGNEESRFGVGLQVLEVIPVLDADLRTGQDGGSRIDEPVGIGGAQAIQDADPGKLGLDGGLHLVHASALTLVFSLVLDGEEDQVNLIDHAQQVLFEDLGQVVRGHFGAFDELRPAVVQGPGGERHDQQIKRQYHPDEGSHKGFTRFGDLRALGRHSYSGVAGRFSPTHRPDWHKS